MLIDIRLSSKKKYIDIDDIVLSKHFEKSEPSLTKILMHHQDYCNNGWLEPIIIDEENRLIDGYISYIILKHYGRQNITVYKIKAKIADR